MQPTTGAAKAQLSFALAQPMLSLSPYSRSARTSSHWTQHARSPPSLTRPTCSTGLKLTRPLLSLVRTAIARPTQGPRTLEGRPTRAPPRLTPPTIIPTIMRLRHTNDEEGLQDAGRDGGHNGGGGNEHDEDGHTMVGYAGRGLTVVAVSAKGSTQPATHGRPRQSEADAQWAAISKHGRICIVGPVVLVLAFALLSCVSAARHVPCDARTYVGHVTRVGRDVYSLICMLRTRGVRRPGIYCNTRYLLDCLAQGITIPAKTLSKEYFTYYIILSILPQSIMALSPHSPTELPEWRNSTVSHEAQHIRLGIRHGTGTGIEPAWSRSRVPSALREVGRAGLFPGSPSPSWNLTKLAHAFHTSQLYLSG